MSEFSWLVPPAFLQWLAVWGPFTGVVIVILAFFVLGLRKFFLWRKGTTEIMVYLKHLTELQEKSLIELELLNKALRTPLKKAAAALPEAPREVPMKERENMLAALRAARKTLPET